MRLNARLKVRWETDYSILMDQAVDYEQNGISVGIYN